MPINWVALVSGLLVLDGCKFDDFVLLSSGVLLSSLDLLSVLSSLEDGTLQLRCSVHRFLDNLC